jgi:hypothetical protein
VQDRKFSSLLALANRILFAPNSSALVQRHGNGYRGIACLLLCAFLAMTIARSNAQPPNSPFVQGSERKWRGNAFQVQSSAPAKTPAGNGQVPSVATRAEGTASRFALAFKASTLGLGADLGVRIIHPLNLRVGFSTFHFGAELDHDGVPYEGNLRLRSLQATLDWFPTGRSFHVSPGVVFHNDNRVTATSTPPVGQVEAAGDVIFLSDPQNPITGKAKSSVGSVSPMIVLGFGNLIPRSRHFGYSVDLGVVYQGHPTSTFVLVGTVCDPSGAFCTDIANDAETQKAVKNARRDLDKGVSFMRYYPVVSVEFAYRF